MLARWIAPDGRMLRAAEFIDTAGETGLLDRHVGGGVGRGWPIWPAGSAAGCRTGSG